MNRLTECVRILLWKNNFWRRQTRVTAILMLQMIVWISFVALGVSLKGNTYTYHTDVSGENTPVTAVQPVRLHLSRSRRTDAELFTEIVERLKTETMAIDFVDELDDESVELHVEALDYQPFFIDYTLNFPEKAVPCIAKENFRPYVHDCRRFSQQTCEVGKYFKSGFVQVQNLWMNAAFETLWDRAGGLPPLNRGPPTSTQLSVPFGTMMFEKFPRDVDVASTFKDIATQETFLLVFAMSGFIARMCAMLAADLESSFDTTLRSLGVPASAFLISWAGLLAFSALAASWVAVILSQLFGLFGFFTTPFLVLILFSLYNLGLTANGVAIALISRSVRFTNLYCVISPVVSYGVAAATRLNDQFDKYRFLRQAMAIVSTLSPTLSFTNATIELIGKSPFRGGHLRQELMGNGQISSELSNMLLSTCVFVLLSAVAHFWHLPQLDELDSTVVGPVFHLCVSGKPNLPLNALPLSVKDHVKLIAALLGVSVPFSEADDNLTAVTPPNPDTKLTWNQILSLMQSFALEPFADNEPTDKSVWFRVHCLCSLLAGHRQGTVVVVVSDVRLPDDEITFALDCLEAAAATLRVPTRVVARTVGERCLAGVNQEHHATVVWPPTLQKPTEKVELEPSTHRQLVRRVSLVHMFGRRGEGALHVLVTLVILVLLIEHRSFMTEVRLRFDCSDIGRHVNGLVPVHVQRSASGTIFRGPLPIYALQEEPPLATALTSKNYWTRLLLQRWIRDYRNPLNRLGVVEDFRTPNLSIAKSTLFLSSLGSVLDDMVLDDVPIETVTEIDDPADEGDIPRANLESVEHFLGEQGTESDIVLSSVISDEQLVRLQEPSGVAVRMFLLANSLSKKVFYPLALAIEFETAPNYRLFWEPSALHAVPTFVNAFYEGLIRRFVPNQTAAIVKVSSAPRVTRRLFRIKKRAMAINSLLPTLLCLVPWHQNRGLLSVAKSGLLNVFLLMGVRPTDVVLTGVLRTIPGALAVSPFMYWPRVTLVALLQLITFAAIIVVAGVLQWMTRFVRVTMLLLVFSLTFAAQKMVLDHWVSMLASKFLTADQISCYIHGTCCFLLPGYPVVGCLLALHMDDPVFWRLSLSTWAVLGSVFQVVASLSAGVIATGIVRRIPYKSLRTWTTEDQYPESAFQLPLEVQHIWPYDLGASIRQVEYKVARFREEVQSQVGSNVLFTQNSQRSKLFRAANPSLPLLIVHKLSVEAGTSTEALIRRLSLHVMPGESLVIVGPQLSGKTTLIKAICNEIVKSGENVVGPTGDVGIAYANLSYLEVGLELQRLFFMDNGQELARWGLRPHAYTRLTDLPRHLLKRVSLALAFQSQLVILDEPSQDADEEDLLLLRRRLLLLGHQAAIITTANPSVASMLGTTVGFFGRGELKLWVPATSLAQVESCWRLEVCLRRQPGALAALVSGTNLHLVDRAIVGDKIWVRLTGTGDVTEIHKRFLTRSGVLSVRMLPFGIDSVMSELHRSISIDRQQ